MTRPPLQSESYEQWLREDLHRGLGEGDHHFAGRSYVWETLRDLTALLEAMGLQHAVVGTLALFAHGYRRFTSNVDILINAADVEQLSQTLQEKHYIKLNLPRLTFRHPLSKVVIHVHSIRHISPFTAPSLPEDVLVWAGFKVLVLRKIIEFKLRPGRTELASLHDLADVQEAIKHIPLDASLANQLHDSVRAAYLHHVNLAPLDTHGKD